MIVICPGRPDSSRHDRPTRSRSTAVDIQSLLGDEAESLLNGGIGPISGRKAFQRPTAEGVDLLNAIQDVYLDRSVTIA